MLEFRCFFQISVSVFLIKINIFALSGCLQTANTAIQRRDFWTWKSLKTFQIPFIGQFKYGLKFNCNVLSSALLVPLILLLNKIQQAIIQNIYIETGQQSFTSKKTAVGRDIFLKIPRNYLEILLCLRNAKTYPAEIRKITGGTKFYSGVKIYVRDKVT